MTHLMNQLYRDEAGFIVSAELVLVATVLVLGMVVGLAEVANSVNEELEDIGSAFGSVNQSYRYAGLAGHKGRVNGSRFKDHFDDCDDECDITCDTPVRGERPKYHY